MQAIRHSRRRSHPASVRTRRKRIARPKRSTSRQRFRIKAPRLPKLKVPESQQRELAGIGFLLLAGLLVLAVALQASGSAMDLLRGGLVGLFGWGVVFVILAALVAARSEEHTSELQSLTKLVCRLSLEKKNQRR